MKTVETHQDVTVAPRMYVGYCECTEWNEEYRLRSEEFEIGCMSCLSRFKMSVKEEEDE